MKQDIFLRRDQIDRIRLHLHAVFRLDHRHFRIFPQNIRHQAFIIGSQMLDYNKAQPAVGRHEPKKLLQRLQPAGRSAQPYHKHLVLFAGLFISHFVGLLCLVHNPLLSFIPPAPCPVHFPAVLVRAAVHKLCRALFLRLKIPFFKFLHRHGLPVKIPLGIPPAVL